jgi:hypothetical protein
LHFMRKMMAGPVRTLVRERLGIAAMGLEFGESYRLGLGRLTAVEGAMHAVSESSLP